MPNGRFRVNPVSFVVSVIRLVDGASCRFPGIEGQIRYLLEISRRLGYLNANFGLKTFRKKMQNFL